MSSSSHKLISTSVAWTRSYSDARMKDCFKSSQVTTQPWQTQKKGWVKLNIDGSFTSHIPSAGIGGVIRGSNGNWVTGFSMEVGETDSFQVEVRAMYEGLMFAWSRGFHQVDVESDWAN